MGRLTIMPKKGLTTASHSQITRACGNACCRHLPETPFMRVFRVFNGAIAQLGERLLCKQEVVGSIPSGSTNAVGLALCGKKLAVGWAGTIRACSSVG